MKSANKAAGTLYLAITAQQTSDIVINIVYPDVYSGSICLRPG